MATTLNINLLSTRMKVRRVGMTLRDVEAQTGVSASTLSRIENGKKLPDLNTFLRLCDWMNTPPETFFGSDDSRVAGQTSTLETVEIAILSDVDLDSEFAEALVKMIRAAYSVMDSD